jgi:hypothetical protein
MADQDLELIDSTVQKTHEWLGAIAEASHLSKALGRPLTLNLSSRLQRRTTIGEGDAAKLSTLSPHTRTSSSSASVCFPSARHQQHAILAAGHDAILAAGNVLVKLAVAAIPVVISLIVSVLAIAAFVGGYLAALR